VQPVLTVSPSLHVSSYPGSASKCSSKATSARLIELELIDEDEIEDEDMDEDEDEIELLDELLLDELEIEELEDEELDEDESHPMS